MCKGLLIMSALAGVAAAGPLTRGPDCFGCAQVGLALVMYSYVIMDVRFFTAETGEAFQG